MDQMKMKKLKDGVCDRLEQMDASDLTKPAMVEYAKNLASLHNKICKMCEDEEGGEYSNRGSMRGGSYRDGIEWGAYSDGAYARGRDSMGRYTSYAGYSEAGSPKEKLRRMLDDPGLSREDREEIKRTMERMQH